MNTLPKLDSTNMFASLPKAGGAPSSSIKRGGGSTDPILNLGAPTQAKDSSPLNAYSDKSFNNNSNFSAPSDFKSTLKSRMESPIDETPRDRDTKDISDIEDGDGPAPVVLADSDTANTAVVSRVPIQAKVKAPTIVNSDPDGMSHRVAWNSFLHKMKERLGVSANDILKAFKSLTEEELKQPPELNIAKLVQQLGLNDQQASMAHLLFKELIIKTDSQPMEQNLKAGPDQAALAMVTQREMQAQKTEQALNKMNQQFFMKPTPPTEPLAKEAIQRDQKSSLAETSALAPLKNISELAKPAASLAPTTPAAAAPTQGIELPPELMQASEPTNLAVPPEMLQPATAKPVAPALMKETKALKTETPPWMDSSAMSDLPMTQPMAEALAPIAPKMTAKNFTNPVPNFEPPASNVTPSPLNAAPMPIPVVPNPVFSSPDKGQDENTDESVSEVGMEREEAAAAGAQFALNKTDGKVAVAPNQPSPVMAVPELVQQAHVMVKDGGGEMKVTLRPEGLGEVAMKVSVNGDKVNVQMITQSDEAKKVLESSFHSLRDGLSLHQLNLETIKIDTASNLGRQMEQQYQDAQRQQARQFLEQFHQNNQGFRRSFFDIPGADVYRSQAQRTPVGSEPAQKSDARSRRLNLVA